MSEYITIKRAELEQAMEALEDAARCVQENYLPDQCGHDWDKQITALRAALAQQALQEPVGRVVSANCEYATVQWLKQTSDVGGGDPKNSRSWPIAGDAVYTAPPQQTYPVYYEVSSVVTHNLWMRVSKSQYDEYIRSGWEGRTLHALTQQNITDSNKEN